MARPQKNNCDYFPHDNNMRNHVKVKAVRNKFKNGYAIWVMLLEYLTSCDGNTFEKTDLQMELLSGDFGFSVAEISYVIDYCILLELLFIENEWIYSFSLDERLKPVYDKRGKSKQLSAKQSRTNGRFCLNITEQAVVSVAETPQSKGKEIKENEIERENTPPPEKNRFLIEIQELENYLVSQEQWLEVICMQNKIDKGGAVGWIRKFVEKLKSENVKEKTPADAHSHFSNWLKYELPKSQENGTKKQQDNSSGFARKGYDPNNGIGDGTLMSDTRRPDKQKNGIWYEFKNGEYVVRAIQNPNQRNMP